MDIKIGCDENDYYRDMWDPVLKIYCNDVNSKIKNSSIIRGLFVLNGLGIACGTDKGEVLIHDLETGKRILSLEKNSGITNYISNINKGINDIKCDFSGNYIIFCYSTGEIYIHDLRIGLEKGLLLNSQVLSFFNTHRGSCTSISFPKYWNLQFIYTGGYDGYIRTWDIRKDGYVSQVLAHEGPITSLELNYDSRILSSTSFDGKIRMWRSSNLQLLKTLSGPQNSDYTLHSSFSYDGEYLQCMGNNSSCIWNFKGNQPKKENILWGNFSPKDDVSSYVFNNELIPKYTGFSAIWEHQLIIPRIHSSSNLGDAFIYGLHSANYLYSLKNIYDSNSIVTCVSSHPNNNCKLILTTSSYPESSFVIWIHNDTQVSE